MNYTLTFKQSNGVVLVAKSQALQEGRQEDILAVNYTQYSIKRDEDGRIPIQKVVDRFIELHPGSSVRIEIKANDRYVFGGSQVNSLILNSFPSGWLKKFLEKADKSKVDEILIRESSGLEEHDLAVPFFSEFDFPSLKTLIVGRNNPIDSINLKRCSLLTELELTSNKLSFLDLSNLSMLVKLNLSDNRLTTIDLTSLPRLEVAILRNNELKEIKVSNPELKKLIFSGNKIEGCFRLTKKTAPKLWKFDCSCNDIRMLRLPSVPLKYVRISRNLILDAFHYRGNCGEEISFSSRQSHASQSFALCVADLDSFEFSYSRNNIFICSNVDFSAKPRDGHTYHVFERFFHRDGVRKVVNTLPLPIAEEILEHISSFKTDYARELDELDLLENELDEEEADDNPDYW